MADPALPRAVPTGAGGSRSFGGPRAVSAARRPALSGRGRGGAPAAGAPPSAAERPALPGVARAKGLLPAPPGGAPSRVVGLLRSPVPLPLAAPLRSSATLPASATPGLCAFLHVCRLRSGGATARAASSFPAGRPEPEAPSGPCCICPKQCSLACGGERRRRLRPGQACRGHRCSRLPQGRRPRLLGVTLALPAVTARCPWSVPPGGASVVQAPSGQQREEAQESGPSPALQAPGRRPPPFRGGQGLPPLRVLPAGERPPAARLGCCL